jgi:hypothetical protein
MGIGDCDVGRKELEAAIIRSACDSGDPGAQGHSPANLISDRFKVPSGLS